MKESRSMFQGSSFTSAGVQVHMCVLVKHMPMLLVQPPLWHPTNVGALTQTKRFKLVAGSGGARLACTYGGPSLCWEDVASLLLMLRHQCFLHV